MYIGIKIYYNACQMYINICLGKYIKYFKFIFIYIIYKFVFL